MIELQKVILSIDGEQRTGKPLKTKRGVTVHDTGNTAKTATAKNHVSYMTTLSKQTGDSSIGYHIVCDDYEAYQLIPFDEMAWHAGDYAINGGQGSYNTVAIELCVYDGIDHNRCRLNGAYLVAQVLYEQGHKHAIDGHKNPLIGNVFQHYDWSGKNCPATIRQDPMLWEVFMIQVEEELMKLTHPVKPINPPTGAVV